VRLIPSRAAARFLSPPARLSASTIAVRLACSVDVNRCLVDRCRRPVQQLTDEITDWQQAAELRQSPIGYRSAEVEALEALPDGEITEALESLTENLCMTVYYADVHGYRYREIAQIMDVPIGTVMSRLRHARRRLRTMLAGLVQEIAS
jgi:RNA polymerase sigma-70 factor, ECF subfamily